MTPNSLIRTKEYVKTATSDRKEAAKNCDALRRQRPDLGESGRSANWCIRPLAAYDDRPLSGNKLV
jgi:hypothetical protein